MPNELSKDELLKRIWYWKNECRICAEHHNYSCDECKFYKLCKQAYNQLKPLIQNQPEITMKDIQAWAAEAQNRVEDEERWGDHVVDVMKEMLEELGVIIIKK